MLALTCSALSCRLAKFQYKKLKKYLYIPNNNKSSTFSTPDFHTTFTKYLLITILTFILIGSAVFASKTNKQTSKISHL